jgi:hypothetical protein
MVKASFDRAAEAIKHNDGEQHGHGEIEETLQNLNAFCAQLATIS